MHPGRVVLPTISRLPRGASPDMHGELARNVSSINRRSVHTHRLSCATLLPERRGSIKKVDLEPMPIKTPDGSRWPYLVPVVKSTTSVCSPISCAPRPTPRPQRCHGFSRRASPASLSRYSARTQVSTTRPVSMSTLCSWWSSGERIATKDRSEFASAS